ncbi:hypothetical protein FQR65_LT14202 [Abscondita terminalis]|nr:hypothetical protein FQR65_LT14202 [Abscondita terminalis]
METVSMSIIVSFILIAGTIQLLIYRKFGTALSIFQLPKSKLYETQIVITLFIPFLELVRFILLGTVIEDKRIYGYMILSLVLVNIAYPFSIPVIRAERKYLLPSIPTGRHGLVLLTFWSLIFISENLVLINIGQRRWWFHLKDPSDHTEMTFFILRYISCLILFMLGLKAPGIMQNSDYFNLNDSTNTLNIPRPVRSGFDRI